MADVNHLSVLLHDVPVGEMTLTKNNGCEFRLLESYKRTYPRPVLGQTFLDDMDKVQTSRSRTPPWFSNLLPEGQLRELIAGRAGVAVHREFFLLRHLGDDLPGAVRIVAEEAPIEEDHPPAPALEQEDPDGTWHFSLAGVQLKFSALREGRGMTIPMSGRGGDWIVKLPDSRFPRVPENEYATMSWAGASGIAVPDIELISVADISGLPPEALRLPEKLAFAVRRFDRMADGKRVHMEDFAQVLGLYPEEKYKKFNYETLANVILRLVGEPGLDEFVRRLIFIAASGNGDAHHKNWTLIYPDGVQAGLSPAYDLVSTIQYMSEDLLALNLGRSKQWEDVGPETFQRLARRIGADETRMRTRVEAATEAIMGAWQRFAEEFGFDGRARDHILHHQRRIPLFSHWMT